MSTLLALLLACGGSDDPATTDADGDADVDADTDADSDSDTDVGTWTHSGAHSGHSAIPAPSGDTAPPFVVDCAAVPNRPVSFQALTGARGYHDVAITDDGFILGQDASGNLMRAAYMQRATPLVPGILTVQGMDWLPNGDLAVMRDANNTLSRVNPITGGLSVITSLPSNGYGVVTGPDGMVYVADYTGGILRVDPATGNRTVLLEWQPFNPQPRVINFSPDYSRMYIGTYMGDGHVYYMDLDQNLDPITAPRVFASGVGAGSYHDALQVDYCGNLYMTDYSTASMFRIDPQGNTSLYLAMPNGQYGHGAKFGNGVGGFRLDALYVPQPYHGNTVAEIVIGVPSRTWDGTPF